MVHARRKLYDMHLAPASPLAKEALEHIGELFAIKREICSRSPKQRLTTRRQGLLPLLATLRSSLDTALIRISGHRSLAQVTRYATSRWETLNRFTTDGRLEMMNNAAERAIKPLALGRRNYLIIGSDSGGEHWAVIASLIETCKLNGTNPHAYLTEALECLVAGHPQSRIDELMPWSKPAPQDVRPTPNLRSYSDGCHRSSGCRLMKALLHTDIWTIKGCAAADKWQFRMLCRTICDAAMQRMSGADPCLEI